MTCAVCSGRGSIVITHACDLDCPPRCGLERDIVDCPDCKGEGVVELGDEAAA
jgi:hypothetical protein